MASGIPTRLSPTDLRRFGLTVALPLLLLALWGMWRQHPVLPWLLGGLALTLGALAVLSPDGLRPVHRVWMRGADLLAWVNTRLVLGLVYFLVMTPIGLLMRLAGRDPLDRRLGDRPSYWMARGPLEDSKGSMERRF